MNNACWINMQSGVVLTDRYWDRIQLGHRILALSDPGGNPDLYRDSVERLTDVMRWGTPISALGYLNPESYRYPPDRFDINPFESRESAYTFARQAWDNAEIRGRTRDIFVDALGHPSTGGIWRELGIAPVLRAVDALVDVGYRRYGQDCAVVFNFAGQYYNWSSNERDTLLSMLRGGVGFHGLLSEIPLRRLTEIEQYMNMVEGWSRYVNLYGMVPSGLSWSGITPGLALAAMAQDSKEVMFGLPGPWTWANNDGPKWAELRYFGQPCRMWAQITPDRVTREFTHGRLEVELGEKVEHQ